MKLGLKGFEMEIKKKQLDTEGRKIILQLRHDPGSPKGEQWCDGYHEGLADMLGELKKRFE